MIIAAFVPEDLSATSLMLACGLLLAIVVIIVCVAVLASDAAKVLFSRKMRSEVDHSSKEIA